jgi:threonine/homoserine/homoserine lactone efflux protein
LTLSNPKVIVFFLSILPLVVDLGAINPPRFFEIATASTAILSGTLTAYALAANRVRGWLRSTRAVKLVQRATAGVMAGVAVAVATR